MVDNFPTFIERVVKSEGAFSNRQSDPGNWTGGRVGKGELKGTKYGISAMSYPDLDIINLTREAAIAIYKRDFWEQVDGPSLPQEFAFQALDAAVNSGIGNAIRWMQRAAGVADDGKFGPITEARIRSMGEGDLVLKFTAVHLRFISQLSIFCEYGGGLINRIAANLDYAALDN